MEEKLIPVIRRPEVMRWAVTAALIGLAGLCGLITLSLILRAPFAALVMAVLVFGCLWMARRVFMTDATSIMFDGDRIYDDTGAELCRLDDIAEIERGLALFKPSGGFVLRMKTEGPRSWAPGLWWRAGKRVGIGGATSARAGKHMADAITGALAQRMVDAAEKSGELKSKR